MAVTTTSGTGFPSLSGMAISYDDNFPIADAAPKRHAACDECRKRKLKCSGELAGCRRCVKQSLFCHYSIQKQMGRPPKKRMRESDTINSIDLAGSGGTADLGKEWSSSIIPSDTFHLCPPVYLNHPGGSDAQDRDTQAIPVDQYHRLQPISATATPWPDFSTTSAASSMLSMNSQLSDLSSEFMSTMSSPRTLQCPCLSYLYLCLSTLSTLNSFPISVHTLNSLYTAVRTARSVIQCEVCPQAFATGLQNVMMLGTLLSVVADAWLRVSQADAEDLGRQTAPPAFQASITQDPQGAKATWKQWLRQIVRRAVIGGPVDPNICVPSGVCEQTPNLLSLIREMETRQRRWHAEGVSRYTMRKGRLDYSPQQPSNETSPGSTGTSSVSDLHQDLKEEKECIDERNMLCLKIVGAANGVITQFGFEPHEYPKSASPL